MIHSDADRAMQSLSKYDQAEVYVSKCVVKTVYIDDSRISNIETKTDSGMMARMIEGGRSGKASVSLNRGDAVPSCIGMAEAVLRHSPEDGERHRFPEPQDPLIQAPDVWDTDVVRATPDDLRELAGRLIDSCDVKIPRALIRLSTNECCTMNSNGVDVFHSSTLVYGHFTSMAVIDHPGEGTETFHGTHLDIDLESIGRRLSEKARSAASCREFRGSRRLSMILHPASWGI